jgi:hypothetical protein
MAFSSTELLPCGTFFASGRTAFGVAALAMQASIIFWPQASAWAKRFKEDSGVDRLLAEFAEAHRVPVDPYAAPSKRFRQAA